MHYWFETKNAIPNAPWGCKDKLLSGRQFKEIHPSQQRQTKCKQGHNELRRAHSNHNANSKIKAILSKNHTNKQRKNQTIKQLIDVNSLVEVIATGVQARA
jgi:hypothetical protein